jgi:hypothetical protein
VFLILAIKVISTIELFFETLFVECKEKANSRHASAIVMYTSYPSTSVPDFLWSDTMKQDVGLFSPPDQE